MVFKCVIRAAKREDMTAVVKMIQDLAVFHKMPKAAKMTVKDLEHDGFKREPPAFQCMVAELDRRIVGYAMYFPAYSSWDGRAVLLEDLYVMRSQRQKGIGERLFDAVAKEAATTGCARLDFHVVEWNKASTFYEGKGAVNLTKQERWCYFRLSGEALQRFADEKSCIPKK